MASFVDVLVSRRINPIDATQKKKEKKRHSLINYRSLIALSSTIINERLVVSQKFIIIKPIKARRIQ